MPRKRPGKYRHWCLTINYSYEDDAEEPQVSFDPESMDYLLIGKEVAPTTGQKHLQGYVVFSTRKRRTQILRFFPDGVHLENMKGTVLQNLKYCKKEGHWTEWGTPPLTKAMLNQQQSLKLKSKWEFSYKAAKTGDFELIDPSMRVRYYAAWKRIAQDNPVKPNDLLEFQNIWIQAPTGYGKSHYARKEYPDYYDKSPNKWWVGYRGQPTVICDDFSPKQCEHLGWYMKRWADLYSFPMETKGGGRQIRPKRIIVTSQYSINECFQDPRVQDAMHRRFDTLFLEPWEQREERKRIDALVTDEILIDDDSDEDTATTVELEDEIEVDMENLTFAEQNGYFDPPGTNVMTEEEWKIQSNLRKMRVIFNKTQ